MIAIERARRAAVSERPAFAWDATRGLGTLTLRLFGSLGARELAHVLETVRDRARSPRDLVVVDFEQTRHIEYHAIPELAEGLARLRARGAVIWLTGMSDYVRCLFAVAGQGPTLARLLWNPEGEAAPPRRFPLERDRSAQAAGALRERAWR